MLTTLVCGTRHLILNPLNAEYVKYKYVLSSKIDLVEKWHKEKDVIGWYGCNELKILWTNPFFFFSGKKDEIFNGGINDLDFDGLTEINSHLLSGFAYGLWFVKDNSVNIDKLFLHCPEKNIFQSRTRLNLFSNCKGVYEPVEFSIEELKAAEVLANKFFSLSPSMSVKAGQIKSDDNKSEEKVTTSPVNTIQYSTHNRFARANMFLMLARQNSFLPLKISFYAAIYESLFTTDNLEVTHKVSERATCFIGGDVDEKLTNFSWIKKAYGIRSAYVHGQELKEKHEKLVEISENIDRVTRKLLLRIIESDNSVFLEKDNKIAGDIFNKMVLSGTA
jgi:hypothetical protein